MWNQIDARTHSNLSVAVCDQHRLRLVQASSPSTELLLCQLGEGQGGGGGDHQHHEGQGGHLDPGDSNQSNYGKPGTSLTRLIMQSRMGKDESERGAGANCGRCKSRASKRSLEPAAAAACALATNAPPPVTPMPTKPRHEEEEWRRRQEGKRSLGRHGFYQASLLFASLSLCIFSSSFLYISTVVVANLSANPWPRQCSVLGWSMYCPSEGISNDFFKAPEDI